MNTETVNYHTLLALAHGDTPLTCAEIWDAMNAEYRPKERVDGRSSANVSSHMAQLYAEHFVDRRKREDVRNKPFEYWLAAKGRKELRANGHLPEQEDGDSPMPVNSDETVGTAEQDAPEPDVAGETEPETVLCDYCERELDVAPDQDSRAVVGGHLSSCPEKPEDEDDGTDPNVADPDAIAQDLGLDDPNADSERALAEALAGVVSTLRETEEAVDSLRASAVTEDEAEGIRDDYTQDIGILQDQIDTLTEQVTALGRAQAQEDGVDTPFRPFIKRLKQLDGQGYGLYEGEIATEYGGNVVEVRVKAKPKGKCNQKGPDEADADRATAAEAAETVAEHDIDPEYEVTDE